MTVQGPNSQIPPEILSGKMYVNKQNLEFSKIKEKLSGGIIKRLFEGIGRTIDAKRVDSKLQKLSILEKVRSVVQNPTEAAQIDEQIASVRTSLNKLAHKRIENAIPMLLHDCNRALSNLRPTASNINEIKEQLAKASVNLITLSTQIQGTSFGKSENMDILKATLELVQSKLKELNTKPIVSEQKVVSEQKASPWKTDNTERKARLDALLEKGKAERAQQLERSSSERDRDFDTFAEKLKAVDAGTSLHDLDDDLADLLKDINATIDQTQKDLDERKNKPQP